MLRQLFVSVCLCAATAAAADPVRLDGGALRDAVAGSLIALDTPLNSKLPIRFSHDGFLSGEAGELASYLGSPTDRGRWWISGDRLCCKWFRWFDAEARCATIRQDGTRIYWSQDDGKDGTATILEEGKLSTKPPEQRARTFEMPQFAKSETAVTVAAAPPPASVLATPAAPPATGETPPAPVVQRKQPVKAVAAPAKAADVKKTKRPAPPAVAAVTAPRKPIAPATPKNVAAAPAANAAAFFRVEGVENDDILNVRSGPSEYHPAIGTIPPTGRGVKLIGPCVNDWCPVRHRGITGWVNGYYLAREPVEGRSQQGTQR